MKDFLSSRRLFIMGFILLIVTNIVVLAGVASNRRGAPDSQVSLTERELSVPYGMKVENSGLSLRIIYRVLGPENTKAHPGWRRPVWFNADKLKELGFKVDDYFNTNKAADYKREVPKEVFVVLEYDGDSYNVSVKRATAALKKEKMLLAASSQDKRARDAYKSAEERLKREQLSESRLFVIDAGLNAKKLRQKYKDRARFIIANALVEPRYTRRNKKKEAWGYVDTLSIANIHVPLDRRGRFESIISKRKLNKNKFPTPRYVVDLAYGSRFEPWIVSVRLLDLNSE